MNVIMMNLIAHLEETTTRWHPEKIQFKAQWSHGITFQILCVKGPLYYYWSMHKFLNISIYYCLGDLVMCFKIINKLVDSFIYNPHIESPYPVETYIY